MYLMLTHLFISYVERCRSVLAGVFLEEDRPPMEEITT